MNPKNLVLTADAAMSIAQAGLPGGQQAGVLAVFIVVGTVTVAAPLIVYLALGRKADSMLNGWREWLTASNGTIMLVLSSPSGWCSSGRSSPACPEIAGAEVAGRRNRHRSSGERIDALASPAGSRPHLGNHPDRELSQFQGVVTRSACRGSIFSS